MSPTVLIADDHPIVRAGIRRLLERRDDLEIVKEVGDGQEALEGILKSQPDLAILDVEMPRLSGIEVSRKVRESGSATATVVLSVHTSGTAVRGALEAGAAGYVVKTADIGELVQALDTVRSGGRYLSPGILRLVVDEIAEPPGDKVDRLTNREREVLTLIAEGYSSPEIALQLGVAAKTISTHRSNLMEKLKIHKVSAHFPHLSERISPPTRPDSPPQRRARRWRRSRGATLRESLIISRCMFSIFFRFSIQLP